jgi:hypothetical protein
MIGTRQCSTPEIVAPRNPMISGLLQIVSGMTDRWLPTARSRFHHKDLHSGGQDRAAGDVSILALVLECWTSN